MKVARRNAIATIEKTTDRVHDQFNKRTTLHEIKEGDRVYLYEPANKIGVSSKLTKKWKGPYRVTQDLSPTTNPPEPSAEIEIAVPTPDDNSVAT
ncbi:hypothetical protein BDFB_014049, partial [Asbolus verrucosus]